MSGAAAGPSGGEALGGDGSRPSGAGAHVAVIGGGVAGIAAALDCAAAGARVTLLEVRPRLGGAAYSFEREGLTMDNGQHVFLRCCVSYRELLARIGGDGGVEVQPRLEIPVLSPGRPVAVLRRSGLPAPLHLAGALVRYPYLGWRGRLGAARAALALARLPVDAPELDGRTLGSWLAARGQGPEAVAALWDLIALPTLNLPAAEASLALGVFVFRTGLLDKGDAGDIGFHRRPLGEIVGAPAERALRAAGVEVRLGFRVRELRRDGERFEVLGGYGAAGAGAGGEAGGGEQHSPGRPGSEGRRDADEDGRPPDAEEEGLVVDGAIVALPRARAAKLLAPLDPRTASAAETLGDAPIVNLHVVYDREVCDLPFAAGVGTPVQYVFDRSEAGGVGPGRQYLAISLSGARREMQMSVDELRERYEPALVELFPRAREAKLELFLATREHAATFRGQPGSAALRGGPGTAVAGVALAGAWTATGGPATLEGATLSGHAAAQAILERL